MNSLFFGETVLPVSVGYDLIELLDRVDDFNKQQAFMVVDAIRRAQNEKRNVYLKYVSKQIGKKVHVTAHIEYMNDGRIGFYATPIDERDLAFAKEEDGRSLAGGDSNEVLQMVYENLPVGLEIYDRDGYLLEINDVDMAMMGVREKSDVLGKNLFDNPNIPSAIKSLVRAGKNVRDTLEYDFDKAARECYDSFVYGVRYLDLMITVIKDSLGNTDKYLLLLRDVSEYVMLRKKYEDLYDQSQIILESLPVGVELYDNEGKLLYLNDTDCRIFDMDKESLLNQNFNLFQDSNLPDEVKVAVRNKEKIQIKFPYKVDAALKNNPDKSTGQESLQIEFKGSPVTNSSGASENYVFIVNDLTDMMKTRGELQQNRLKIEMAMKVAGIVVWELDIHSRMIFSENDPFNQYDHNMLVPVERYVEAIHPDDQPLVGEVLQEVFQGHDQSYELDFRMKFPNATDWEYCTINCSPIEKDAHGKVIKYIGLRRDNTLLKKTKLFQDKILNSIPLPILIKDVEDDFRYVFCNQESKRMFGIVEQQTASSIVSKKQVEKMQKTDLEVFASGEPYFGQEKIVLKDGRMYDTIVRKSVITDNGKRLLLDVRWDQSAQNDLLRRTKVLSISLDALNAYTWFYDSDTRQITYGDGFAKTGGEDHRVNTIEKFASCLHEDDQSRFLEAFFAAVEKRNGDFSIEFRIDFSGKNAYEWWECRGVVESIVRDEVPQVSVYGMSINIDNHKNTELTLLKNKDELNNLILQNELVLNNTNSGLAYIATDYIVQWENVSKCSTSLSHEAYKKGEYCYKSAHNRTSPCENCVMERAIRSKQLEQTRFRLNNARSVEIFATPVLKNGEVDGIVIRVDDVTEQERMIAELRQAKLQAEQSDKLKSAFLANMSHEIRTPLNAIVGFSDLLMTTTDVDEQKEYMRIINTNNELLLKLINDILDLSKIEAGFVELKYEEFDLAEYFEELVAAMRQKVNNPKVDFLSVNPYSGCMVKMDKNRFAQILINYVVNAIKYTPQGFIEMGYEQVEEGIRLYVRDSGIGIPEDKMNKVFNRFEKLDEFAQGTGLGLSICKAIADVCGGSVGFESEYGKGSLFWAIMPCPVAVLSERGLEDEKTIPLADENGWEDLSPVERKTIVIAEDLQCNYLLVSALLERYYHLIHAKTGKQAVEFVRTNPQVDIVLMDMKMPEMDGLTAVREIRKFNSNIPIVALTAHAFDADRQAALAAGCNDYVVKPIDKVKLMGILKKYSLLKRF